MICRTLPRFMAIGNRLGGFLDVDMNFEVLGWMVVTRILVHMDFKKCFPPDISIVTPRGWVLQVLDYEGILFRCHKCNHYGHVMASCPMTSRVYPDGGMEGVDVHQPCMDPLMSQVST